MLNFWLRQLLVWGAAALTIALSCRLYMRFRRKYLRDWFLFTVVFNLALYSFDLVRTVFPELIDRGGQDFLQRFDGLFNALLVRPLLFIGLLLFLRFISGLMELTLPWSWRLLIPAVIVVHLLVIAYLAVQAMDEVQGDRFKTMTVVSDWLAIGGLYGGVAFMQWQTHRHEREPRQSRLRNLGILFFLCQTVFIFFPAQKAPLRAGFFLILPPLIYLWRIHDLLFMEQRELGLPVSDVCALFKDCELTEREEQIVRMICQGMDNQAISDELFVSVHTVKHHVTAIFRKLKVSGRLQLVNLASNLGHEKKGD